MHVILSQFLSQHDDPVTLSKTMKAGKVLAFILGVFILMGIGWVFWPAEGIVVFGYTLRFPSMQRKLAEAGEKKVDVDAVIDAVEESFEMQEDTLSYYRNYFRDNANRIYLPEDDYAYFDSVFFDFERGRRCGKVYRIAHYGDSQIEMDRLSAELREALQERFGGEGTGMFPIRTNVPSASVVKSTVGKVVHYTMYGDSLTRRAPHNRYGVMAQLNQVYGSSIVHIRPTGSKTAFPRTRTFSRLSLLLGRNTDRFSARVISDTLKFEPKVLAKDTRGAVLLTWDFPYPVEKASLYLLGNAEIYGAMTDGRGGVAVDNIPLRGCSGTIFTRIDENLMRRSFALDDTRLIILQFGGNYMPAATSTKVIEGYQAKIANQIRYFRRVAPAAKILFIGPSDMGKSVGGRIVTWPRLPEMVDSLKSTALSNGVAYWDLYRVMGGENSMKDWVKHNPPYAGPDYIHFTQKGARIVGDALARSLLVYYDFYTLRKTLPGDSVEQFMKQ